MDPLQKVQKVVFNNFNKILKLWLLAKQVKKSGGMLAYLFLVGSDFQTVRFPLPGSVPGRCLNVAVSGNAYKRDRTEWPIERGIDPPNICSAVAAAHVVSVEAVAGRRGRTAGRWGDAQGCRCWRNGATAVHAAESVRAKPLELFDKKVNIYLVVFLINVSF